MKEQPGIGWRLPHIDGLRGILAVIVFIHHFLFLFAPSFIIGGEDTDLAVTATGSIYHIFAYTPLNILANPSFAVGTFFIISGYVLGFRYYKSQDEALLRYGIVKRYIRLAVPVLGSCLLIYLLHLLHLFHKTYHTLSPVNREWITGTMTDSIKTPFELIRYALIDVFLGNSRYNPVLWTMAPELSGSFFVFIFLLISHRLKSHIKMILLLIIFCFQIYMKSYAANFTLGMALGMSELSYTAFATLISRKLVRLILFLAGLYLASYPFYAVEEAVKNSIYSYVFVESVDSIYKVHMAGNFLLFTAFIAGQKIHKVFAGPAFDYLGRISFGLYLVHLPVIFVIGTHFFDLLHDRLIYGANVSITFAVTLIFLLAISWIFYLFIDRYALIWASKFAKFLWK